MTPELTINLLRALFVTFTTCIGLAVGDSNLRSILVCGSLGTCFGLSVVLVDRLLKGISLRLFSSATFGLLMGFIFARLLLASDLLRRAPDDVQWLTGLILYAASGYLAMMLAIRSNRDEFALMIPYIRFRRSTIHDEPVLVDSNVIIDGRLAALCATGFLTSSLIVPRFVLDEIQYLADSPDPLKRERGRSALDRLEQMQHQSALNIAIHESEPQNGMPVDSRLAHLAKVLNVRLLTNDANLCAIARIQGVVTLNVNDLTRALSPVLCAGQEIELALVKEGREAHQAVGYLQDGTMIIVNHARTRLGKSAMVIIASAHQTSAGRLFFAELKG